MFIIKKKRFLKLDVTSISKISLAVVFIFFHFAFPLYSWQKMSWIYGVVGFFCSFFLQFFQSSGGFWNNSVRKQLTWWHSSLSEEDSPSLRIRQGINNNNGLSMLLFILLTLDLILKDVECSGPGPGKPCLSVSLNQCQNAQNHLG